MGAAVKLSHVSQTHSIRAEEKTKHRPPVRTTFRHTLNAPATVALTFAHKKSGVKSFAR